MILIDKAKLKFLQAGRTLTIQTPRTPRFRYRQNHHYNIGIIKGRSIFQVLVEHVEEHPDHWTLTIRQAEYDTPSYLRKVSGYTTDPSQAIPHEPEPVKGAELQRMTDAAREHDTLRRLVPAHGSLAKINEEIANLRSTLAAGGQVDRGLHEALVRLERARERLQRKLAS